ncbi:hypothetical protein MPNT_160010 [Candidatus Methylacidithermus pantelleriae]|uniref:Uncharacterized protein n=1 Tax=Candidatus Methylacidithermus pantelleriae TaxID=2744239 RepID=A0A8J2BH92_9BACT|nr:hypothetical protein MPNT_160010 [Candidatus Methylacidithermus pantelleriae]
MESRVWAGPPVAARVAIGTKSTGAKPFSQLGGSTGFTWLLGALMEGYCKDRQKRFWVRKTERCLN